MSQTQYHTPAAPPNTHMRVFFISMESVSPHLPTLQVGILYLYIGDFRQSLNDNEGHTWPSFNDWKSLVLWLWRNRKRSSPVTAWPSTVELMPLQYHDYSNETVKETSSTLNTMRFNTRAYSLPTACPQNLLTRRHNLIHAATYLAACRSETFLPPATLHPTEWSKIMISKASFITHHTQTTFRK